MKLKAIFIVGIFYCISLLAFSHGRQNAGKIRLFVENGIKNGLDFVQSKSIEDRTNRVLEDDTESEDDDNSEETTGTHPCPRGTGTQPCPHGSGSMIHMHGTGTQPCPHGSGSMGHMQGGHGKGAADGVDADGNPLSLEGSDEGEGHGEGHGEEEKIPFGSTRFFIYALICVGITCYAGIQSGLTVGYMGINMADLEVTLKTPSSTEEDKRKAGTILPILKKHHLLLVTLLLHNAIAMESLPIFLDAFMPSWMAIIVSTTAVLFFGEVFPQAVFTGPKQLTIAAGLTPFIRILMFISLPISYPIAKLLDWLIGHDHELKKYGVPELKEFLKMQVVQQQHSEGKVQTLTEEELKILISTLELRTTTVDNRMIPKEKVKMVSSESVIDEEFISKVQKHGFSRVLIYTKEDTNNIMGVLISKKLINADITKKNPIRERRRDFNYEAPVFVAKDTNLLEMMRLFQEKMTSMAIVIDKEAKKELAQGQVWNRKNSIVTFSSASMKVLGIITLKDIFREVTGKEFKDIDVHKPTTMISNDGYVVNNLARRGTKTPGLQEGHEESEYVGGLGDPLLEMKELHK